MSGHERTLIFPSSMPAALAYARRAHESGERVLAASSSRNDETIRYFKEWTYLPSIYDGQFEAALLSLLERCEITKFFTAHPLVYHTVRPILQAHAPDVSIASKSPVETLNDTFRNVLERAQEALAFMRAIAEENRFPLLYMAALLHHAGNIYGQTSESKIAALSAAFQTAPRGDVVEIGSAWGRSAFVLTFLAKHFDTGNVLCVDPWNADDAVQKESHACLSEFNPLLDWDLMAQIFKINLLGHHMGVFNYVRMTSEAAETAYAASSLLCSPEFGQTRFSQAISVLHIDGNHDYEHVSADYALWSKHLIPGAWLVMDDYVWEHGGGPRRVGDEALAYEADRIEHSFVAGNALFIRFKR